MKRIIQYKIKKSLPEETAKNLNWSCGIPGDRFQKHCWIGRLNRLILKQWKKPKTVYRNLMKLNVAFDCCMTDEDIFKLANSRLGLYRRCGMNVISFLLGTNVLSLPNKKENRPGLIDPFAYYL